MRRVLPNIRPSQGGVARDYQTFGYPRQLAAATPLMPLLRRADAPARFAARSGTQSGIKRRTASGRGKRRAGPSVASSAGGLRLANPSLAKKHAAGRFACRPGHKGLPPSSECAIPSGHRLVSQYARSRSWKHHEIECFFRTSAAARMHNSEELRLPYSDANSLRGLWQICYQFGRVSIRGRSLRSPCRG
jgi:hypothetical protein